MVAKEMLPVKPKGKVKIGTAVKFGDKLKTKQRVKNYIGQDVSEMAQINRGGNKSGVTKGKYLGAVKRRLANPATRMEKPGTITKTKTAPPSNVVGRAEEVNELNKSENYGQQRSAQAHTQNLARKASRDPTTMMPNKAAIKKRLKA